jgi:hypothetical protein
VALRIASAPRWIPLLVVAGHLCAAAVIAQSPPATVTGPVASSPPLYPSHESYVSSVRRVVEENLAAGYLLPVDARSTLAEAEASAIGR